jgi:hypothetical protein
MTERVVGNVYKNRELRKRRSISSNHNIIVMSSSQAGKADCRLDYDEFTVVYLRILHECKVSATANRR